MAKQIALPDGRFTLISDCAFAPCPYCQIENKDSLIDKLTALTKQLTAENERLRTFLSDILADAVDMGNYYHVKYEAVEQAADALEASIWEES